MSLNISLRYELRMSNILRYASGENATVVKEMIARGLKGDEQALEYLQVTDSYVTPKSELTPTWQSAQEDYHEMVSTFVGAKKFELHIATTAHEVYEALGISRKPLKNKSIQSQRRKSYSTSKHCHVTCFPKK